MTTITYRFTIKQCEDGAYVTTSLDEHDICTHGPMSPSLTSEFIEQAKSWVDGAFESILSDARGRMNSRVEAPQWPPELQKRMQREDHLPARLPHLSPYTR